MKYDLQVRGYRRAFRRPLVTSRCTLRERPGLIIRLENEIGDVGFGEIAPMEFLGTESFEDARAFCCKIGGVVDDEFIESIDGKRGCCGFGFESAREMVRMRGEQVSDREFEVAGLISLGDDISDLKLMGYNVFKCKIGKSDFKREREAFLQLEDQLPEGATLRLDANGAFTLKEAEEWMRFLEGYTVEFLEQPLPKGEERLMRELGRDYRTPIALDESIVNIEDLERVLEGGWSGWLVVKPALIGNWVSFRNLREACELPIVYSSVFETGIGMEAALSVAASDRRNDYALGFGTVGYFYSDGFNGYPVGPVIKSGLGKGRELERIWGLCQSVK